MKKFAKILTIAAMVAIVCAVSIGFAGCNNDKYDLRVVVPEGTPALAICRLKTENKTIAGKKMKYDVINPDNISAEMRYQKSDIIIMPVNGGANLIRQDANVNYKLVSVAVNGSLFLIGKKDGGNVLAFDDIRGKKIACIGEQGVPGLIFRYLMSKNGLQIITSGEPNEDQVFVKYVSGGPMAKGELQKNAVDFAVVGEPAATQFKNALSLNAEMDMQLAYKNADVNNGDSFPQAGLFVKTSLANNTVLMDALFEALAQSREWVINNPTAVTEYVKANLYDATFPPASIPRCAIDCARLTDSDKNDIIAFLKNVVPKSPTEGNIDWDAAKGKIF